MVSPVIIEDFQVHKDVDVAGCIKISLVIQNTLRGFADRGDLMIRREIFEQEIKEEFRRDGLLDNEKKFRYIMYSAEAVSIFHVVRFCC